MKITETNHKTFYASTLRQALKKCLNEGMFPATEQEIIEAKNAGIIDKDKWYNTSTVSFEGKKRTATLKELQNIDEFYSKGGRLWYVGSLNDGSSAGGYDFLNGNLGRFVGVTPEVQSKYSKTGNIELRELRKENRQLKKRLDKIKKVLK